MKTVKLFTMLILISLLGVSCSESEVMSPADLDTSSKTELVGAHYNLNIIGVKDTKAEIEARKLIKSVKARLPCKVGTENIVVKA